MIEQQLKDLLEKNINCHYLEITNESHLHAGHATSPDTGDSHFRLIVVSDDFLDHSKVVRHSMIYKYVNPLFQDGLHALSIGTFTKREYKGM